MDDEQSKQAQPKHTEGSEVQVKDADTSTDREALNGGVPITNPDFSVPVLNPAFTQASPPPAQPLEAQRVVRIRELEQRLEQATKRIERGAEALERARNTR
jgi:hypothetical protein